MSHRERRIVVAVGVLVLASCFEAHESRAQSQVPENLAATATFMESASPLWRAVLGYWLPLLGPADSSRHRPPGGGVGFGRTPTCDAGPSLDPDGRCVHPGARRLVLLPTCDAGPSTDPNGGCRGH